LQQLCGWRRYNGNRGRPVVGAALRGEYTIDCKTIDYNAMKRAVRRGVIAVISAAGIYF